jgi:hypothetical protein
VDKAKDSCVKRLLLAAQNESKKVPAKELDFFDLLVDTTIRRFIALLFTAVPVLASGP